MLEWQCDKSREDLLVEKKLKKYTLPVIAAILTVFALSMTGLYKPKRKYTLLNLIKNSRLRRVYVVSLQYLCVVTH